MAFVILLAIPSFDKQETKSLDVKRDGPFKRGVKSQLVPTYRLSSFWLKIVIATQINLRLNLLRSNQTGRLK